LWPAPHAAPGGGSPGCWARPGRRCTAPDAAVGPAAIDVGEAPLGAQEHQHGPGAGEAIGQVTPGTTEIVAAVKRILLALRDRDLPTLRELIDPEVRFYAILVDESPPAVRTFGADEFFRVVSQSTEPVIERIWNPEVHVEGPVAVLWTPYDLTNGSRFSHCGHAAFNLVLREGIWRLLSETYTVRTTRCDGPR
jgi:hypothetical protein